MNQFLELTPQDPLIARDGRPFGAGQGNRMRGLAWPLPSVVAGSFRTALVKANAELDFTWSKLSQKDLLNVQVAGVFPVHDGQLYLPAPLDCVAEPTTEKKGIKTIYPVRPVDIANCCDWPNNTLRPVMLSESQAGEDFKPATVPVWWPQSQLARWLIGEQIEFDFAFLKAPVTQMRNHVALDADRSAAEDGQIISTANLPVTHLSRFVERIDDTKSQFENRYAEIKLSARVSVDADSLKQTAINFWHPLGGERRLVHWQQCQQAVSGWKCPEAVRQALSTATKIRLVLATPALFKPGWKPDLENGPLNELG